MTGNELKTIATKLGLSQGQLASELGVERTTMNRWMNGDVPLLAEWAIRGYLAQSKWKPATRRKRNLRGPRALREKHCPGCGGAFWWPHSKGVTRRGVSGRIYPARCKTHVENLSACPVTVVYFDRVGNQLSDIPRYGSRPFKRVSSRPTCELCHLPMRSGKTAVRRSVNPKGEIKDERVLSFYCQGERCGKPKHPLITKHTNSKGGLVAVSRGKHLRLTELPVSLRRDYPKCCGRLMARQSRYTGIRKGIRVWWFRCRVCNTNKGFYDSGKPHTRYRFDKRKIKVCPDCKKPIVKHGSPKTARLLQRYVCSNYGYKGQHQTRTRYFHKINGREYILEGRGSSWKAQVVRADHSG